MGVLFSAFFSLSTIFLCVASNVSLLKNETSESMAINKLNDIYLDKEISSEDLKLSMSKGWWKLSQLLILRSHEQGIDISATVRAEALSIKKNADELIRLLNKKHADIAIVSPAFQWAQSADLVFLNIKFTYRWNAPGALRIENENVKIDGNKFHFSGIGSHSHEQKKYLLELELYDEIDVTKSEWNFGSVGKFVVTLAKKEKQKKWPRLLKDANLKIQNMHIWWEMKEIYEGSLIDLNKIKNETVANITNEINNSNTTKSEEL